MEDERRLEGIGRNVNEYFPVNRESTFEMENGSTNNRVDVPALNLPQIKREDKTSHGKAEV